MRIDHFPMQTIDDFIDRLQRYTTQEAQLLQEQGITWCLDSMSQSFIEEFLRRYQPEKDGIHAFMFAGLMTCYRFVAWAKLWEAQGRPMSEKLIETDDLISFLSLSFPKLTAKLAQSAEKNWHSHQGYETRGFFEDEGGWCWLSPISEMRISTGYLASRNSRGFSFILRSSERERYTSWPVHVRIFVNDIVTDELTFASSNEEKRISVVSTVSTEKSMHIRIEVSSQLIAHSDTRDLALIMREFKLDL